MPKFRTARGQLVDFELLQVKEQIKSKPAPENVSERERFIQEKNKIRRGKKPNLKPPKKEEDAVEIENENEKVTQEDKPNKSKTKIKR